MSPDLKLLVRRAPDSTFAPITSDPLADPRDEALICPLVSRELTNSQDLRLGVARILPGQYHLKHHHPNAAEFYYITHGQCVVQLDGEDVIAEPGTLIYVPRNMVHSIKNEADGVCELLYGFNLPSTQECGLIYDE